MIWIAATCGIKWNYFDRHIIWTLTINLFFGVFNVNSTCSRERRKKMWKKFSDFSAYTYKIFFISTNLHCTWMIKKFFLRSLRPYNFLQKKYLFHYTTYNFQVLYFAVIKISFFYKVKYDKNIVMIKFNSGHWFFSWLRLYRILMCIGVITAKCSNFTSEVLYPMLLCTM